MFARVGPNDRPDSIFPNVEVSQDGTVWIVWSAADYAGGDSETYCVLIRDFIQSEREKVHEDMLIDTADTITNHAAVVAIHGKNRVMFLSSFRMWSG